MLSIKTFILLHCTQVQSRIPNSDDFVALIKLVGFSFVTQVNGLFCMKYSGQSSRMETKYLWKLNILNIYLFKVLIRPPRPPPPPPPPSSSHPKNPVG